MSKSPNWGERVVRDLAGPHEVPQRVDRIGGVAASCDCVEISEERSAQRKAAADGVVDRAIWGIVAGAPMKQRNSRTRIERHVPVALSERTATNPHDLAGGQQFIDAGPNAAVGKHIGFEGRGDEASPCKPLHHGPDIGDGRTEWLYLLPPREEPGQVDRIDRFDLRT